MPLHWSPPPHFCKVYKMQAPKHDTPLDAYGSNILSVVYTHQRLMQDKHVLQGIFPLLQQDKDYRILTAVQYFHAIQPPRYHK